MKSRFLKSKIEAWANGPVIPYLYRRHRGDFKISKWYAGDPARLTDDERETVDAVLEYYGNKPSEWLSRLTHSERPWVESRRGLAPGERGNHVISHAAMAEYYASLV